MLKKRIISESQYNVHEKSGLSVQNYSPFIGRSQPDPNKVGESIPRHDSQQLVIFFQLFVDQGRYLPDDPAA
jgi:hypothetical protein